MKLDSSLALVAAGILAFGTAAFGDDTKRTDTDVQKPGDTTTPSASKHGSSKQKKAGKRQQIPRGAGPVGDEGTQGAQSSDVKTPDLSPGSGLEPSVTVNEPSDSKPENNENGEVEIVPGTDSKAN